ncbi:unnamed protein product [Cylicocyclus nassatus]|uniref:NADP-dependent oxidoreductase domain-containing protein n=1 Tax=Cylicocyclus nassatus TaxID=53992 RepID=A0AA36M3D3_CYLNA|nr:unnamed protein product [Cylicocyclus nassatus]
MTEFEAELKSIESKKNFAVTCKNNSEQQLVGNQSNDSPKPGDPISSDTPTMNEETLENEEESKGETNIESRKMAVPMIELNSGYDMPMVGLGTWQIEPQDVGKAVESAIKDGYKHIDCAWMYKNQDAIGKTLKKLFSSAQGKSDRDLFITSKVWNSFHSAEACKKHVLEILDQLQLDYVDLMLIHWPMGYAEGEEPIPKDEGSDKVKFSEEDYLTTYKVLEDYVKEGKIRSIGISNFNVQQLERLLANCRIKPAALQVELHPFLPQKELRAYCKEKGITLIAYSSLANPGSNEFREEGDPNVLKDPVVNNIAKAHGKTPAQVVLRWATQQGILIIPKSVSEERISQNADLFDFTLTDDEMKELDGLECGYRVVKLSESERKHPQCPFNEG